MDQTIEFYQEWQECITKNLQMAGEVQTAYPNREIGTHMILASQIHMNNNRLGIMPQLESVIADALLKCEMW